MKITASSFAFLALVVLSACGKPALPVAVTFREAVLEKSKVAQFHNNSSQALKVIVTCVGKAGDSKASKEILLEPGKPFEIGWLEGWSFLPGEKVVVSSAGFANFSVSVP